MSLDKSSKIYIAGHHGLVGSAIWNNLKARGYENLVDKLRRLGADIMRVSEDEPVRIPRAN